MQHVCICMNIQPTLTNNIHGNSSQNIIGYNGVIMNNVIFRIV